MNDKQLARLKAAVKSARRNNNTSGLGALSAEVHQLMNETQRRHDDEMHEITTLAKLLVTPPAKFKDGFVLAPPEGYRAEAFLDEGWILSYVNDDGDIIEIDWPFECDYVFAQDLEELGFTVEG